MPDVVEKLRQVQIDGDAVAFANVGLYPPQCSRGRTSRSETEARIRKPRIEDRRQNLRDGLLDHPIHNGGNSQQSLPAPVRLRDRHPSDRLGLVATITQGLADLRPARTGKLGEVLDAHPVYTGRTLVGLHPLPCPPHVLAIQDPLHQIVVQGWLRDTTPQRVSPARVRQRLQVVHGSALASHVQPFTASPLQGATATMAFADFCPHHVRRYRKTRCPSLRRVRW